MPRGSSSGRPPSGASLQVSPTCSGKTSPRCAAILASRPEYGDPCRAAAARERPGGRGIARMVAPDGRAQNGVGEGSSVGVGGSAGVGGKVGTIVGVGAPVLGVGVGVPAKGVGVGGVDVA